jgi:zinc protease
MWLDQQTVSRTEEGSIAGLLASRERWGRTMEWDAKREAAVAAVTTAQVNAAYKKYMDSLPISIVKGGDFKKANAYQ